MSIHIKICGFTTVDGLKAAIDAGVDSVGFVLDPSPRQLSIPAAMELARHVPDHVSTVAVCGRPDLAYVQEIAAVMQPDWIQLMSEAVPDPSLGLPILPAFEDGEDLEARVRAYADRIGEDRPLVLADGPKPGSGIVADWRRVESICDWTRLIIAGGLKPDNVGEAIGRLQPWGVDVSSGVEQAPGIKCPDKIQAFVEAVQSAERNLESER